MRNLIVLGGLLLAACGGTGTSSSSSSRTDTVTVDGNSVTATSARAGSAAAQDCKSKPDFAPVYPGGAITICNAAHFDATGKDAGSIIYKTAASPATVLAYVKAETAKAGLTTGVDMPSMYSAVEGTKRTTMTHVEADPAGGTRVVLNWGKSPG